MVLDDLDAHRSFRRLPSPVVRLFNRGSASGCHQRKWGTMTEWTRHPGRSMKSIENCRSLTTNNGSTYLKGCEQRSSRPRTIDSIQTDIRLRKHVIHIPVNPSISDTYNLSTASYRPSAMEKQTIALRLTTSLTFLNLNMIGCKQNGFQRNPILRCL